GGCGRAAARRGRVPPLLLLALRLLRAARPARRRARALRAPRRTGERPRPARRGIRPFVAAHARELPPGVHTSGARQHGVQRVAAPSGDDASPARARWIAVAALISARWLSPCGKLPSCSPEPGSICSAS